MRAKQILSSLLASGCLWTMAGALPPTAPRPAAAQTDGGLYYLYQGQRVPLTVREDAIAVAGSVGSRSIDPFSLRLEEHLREDASQRGDGGDVVVEVSPLGENYALVSIPAAAQDRAAQIRADIEAFADTAAVLPVLTRNGDRQNLVLPNEIVVGFEPDMSEADIQAILTQQDLEIVRPIRFTENRYLVRSRSATGVEVLSVANRLYETEGVQSATPNFIPTRSLAVPFLEDEAPASSPFGDRPLGGGGRPDSLFDRNLKADKLEYETNLLPLLWHLNSVPLLYCTNQETPPPDCLTKALSLDTVPFVRTDLRVPEAWQLSQDGEGVVVAVIDSLIQWDHPNLKDSLHTIENPECPGEVHGWDFSGIGSSGSVDPEANDPEANDPEANDPEAGDAKAIACLGDGDTRISPREVALLQPDFRNSFLLSDADLVKEYPKLTEWIESRLRCEQAPAGCSEERVANIIRDFHRNATVYEFHGTMVAGAIAARPFRNSGAIGVAPNAALMPIRIGAVGQGGTPLEVEEAVRYAANRGADIINMSFGWDDFFPLLQNVDDTIAEVLAENPNLVIVVAAGNEGRSNDPDRVRYPASIDGVIAVGATGLKGYRASYSSYGRGLDVVAPGGDLILLEGGFLTTGGTFVSDLWQGIPAPLAPWGNSFDIRGGLVWTQGTSFASPAVAGVVALMMSEDSQRTLSRDRLETILKETASYEGLQIPTGDREQFDRAVQAGKLDTNAEAERYFFGYGLVNAEEAVKAVREAL